MDSPNLPEIFIKRDIEAQLKIWAKRDKRKPLILRGARQVGKSCLVRHFGLQFEDIVEINFELEPIFSDVFEKDLKPRRILRDLSILKNKPIVPGKTLLFFDEVQSCPKAITALRYFYERLPGQHIIAAGSLIDFVIEQVGVPVGRVEFLHMYPLSFLEFLTAKSKGMYRQAVERIKTSIDSFDNSVHKNLLDILGEYLAVGGMPEAVASWIETQELSACARIHRSLIHAFRQDFAKYSRQDQQKHVETIFSAIPRMLGRKFVYHAVNPDVRSRALRPALELLAKAQIAHIVYHSSSNGVPLGAEANPKLFKVVFMDVALAQTVLGIDLGKWVIDPLGALANRGAVAEAFVGQELLATSTPESRRALHYWTREKRGATSEVDYVTEIGTDVVPVEVKAGRGRYTKSLQAFLNAKKNSSRAIVFSSQQPHTKGNIQYLPLYAVSALKTIFTT